MQHYTVSTKTAVKSIKYCTFYSKIRRNAFVIVSKNIKGKRGDSKVYGRFMPSCWRTVLLPPLFNLFVPQEGYFH